MKDYDDSVAFLGQWGRFQQVVFFLLTASILPNGFGALSVVFLADTPSHHCLVPDVNLTQDWLNAIIPIEVVNGKQQLSRCSRFRLDVVRNLSAQGFIPGRDVNITELEQEGCVDGWSYSRDIYQSTIVSEFDLVCRDQWKQPFTSTIYFLGIFVGAFFSGQLSDRFGRKPVFFTTMAVQTIFIFVQMFSPSWMVFIIFFFISGLGQISNYASAFVLGSEILTGNVRVLFSSLGVCLGFAIGYMMLPLVAYFLRDWKSLLLAMSLPGLLYIPLWWFGRKPVFFTTMAVQMIFTFVQIFSPSWMVFVILLFINGLGQVSNYVSAFVLGNEILTGNVRVLFSSLGVCLGYAIGYMMLPLFAYFLRDWKSLLLAISLPGLLYIPLWWFIPESPRWLLSQGRVEEAETTLRKAAKMNKVKAPSVIFEDYSVHADATKTHPKEQHNVFSLLRTKNIRNMTLIMCLLWFTISTGYIGLSLNTSQLHANPYISCFLSAAVEVPAYTSSWLALRYVPRRLSVFCILLIGGLSLYFLQLVPESLSELSVALEMLGKFVITTGTSLMYAYTAELYPTALRNTATGTCSAVGRVGTSIAPFLLQLSVYFKYLPYIVMGTLAVVSAFATLLLPESFGQPLPQTIQQMHKRESIKCPFIRRREHSKPPVLFESRL